MNVLLAAGLAIILGGLVAFAVDMMIKREGHEK